MVSPLLRSLHVTATELISVLFSVPIWEQESTLKLWAELHFISRWFNIPHFTQTSGFYQLSLWLYSPLNLGLFFGYLIYTQ
jgi:hypothetical protein